MMCFAAKQTPIIINQVGQVEDKFDDDRNDGSINDRILWGANSKLVT